MRAQEFQSFWHGPPLSPYEQLSLRSFLDNGHEFVLWTYDRTLLAPAGVRLAPAEEILPREEAFVLEGYDVQGGFVAFSNLFRFELLSRLGGWWVDLDMVCLRSEIPDFEIFMALERTGAKPCEVGSAALRSPAGHALARRCASECRAVAQRLKQKGAGLTPRDFGQLGATLLERSTAELGLCALAREPTSCYPVHWSEAGRFFSPACRAELEARVADSLMVHLWNEVLISSRRDKGRPPRRGSWLRARFDRHQIVFPPRSPAQRLSDLLDDLARALRRARRRWSQS